MVATAQQNWSSQSAGKALTEQGTPLVMIITVRRVVHELYDGDDDDNHNHGCGKASPESELDVLLQHRATTQYPWVAVKMRCIG